ncbi:MAG: D-alanyl-D-alanine carboxypeptidase [Faecalibacterium sp.]
MKKLFSLCLAFTLCIYMISSYAFAAGYDPSATYDVQAESVYIVNTDTNIILYEKNADLEVSAGGLTKLMTAALILTQYQDVLDSTTITMPYAVSDYVYNTDSADIRAGETVTLRQMLYCMLLYNANDAAQGTAYVLSENDLTGWVSQMNSLSQEIGTTNSVWTDACGIDDGNITTAKDIYLINRYLMSFDAYVEIMGTYQYEMPANTSHSNSYYISSHNKMISETYGGKFYRAAVQGAICDVTGYSGDNTGTQSCVSWSVSGGETYIYAVMSSPDSADTYGYSTRRPAQYETTQLVDWVTSTYSIQSALDPDEPLCEISVKYSADLAYLKLYPDDEILTILPASGDSSMAQKVYNLPDYVTAPIEQGDVIGTVTLVLTGEEIGTANLIAGQSIARNDLLYTFMKLKEFFGSLYVKVVLTLSGIALLIYLCWFTVRAIKQHSNKKIRRH